MRVKLGFAKLGSPNLRKAIAMAAPAATTAPTTAERIRSTCARAGGAMLAIEGVEPIAAPVHRLLADGSFAVTVPADGIRAALSLAGVSGVPAVLEMTDYAPLPLREPVRSLVSVSYTHLTLPTNREV